MTETEADIAASGYRAERQLFDGDTGTFPLQLRQTIVRLLRGPYIDGVADPRLWTTVLDNRQVIADYLCEIFLVLTVDPDRKIAMLTPADVDAPHTTAIQPRKPLRREETLLALRLRLLLDRHAGSGTDATISRAAAREILEEHRQPGAVDDKRLEELTDASLSRLLALKLLLPTELAAVYRVSNALAIALPFDSIDQIPAYIEALARSDAQELLDPDLLDAEALDPEVLDPELPAPAAEGHASGSTVPNNTSANEEEL
ncbi:DUF4194 domain-containing protein [Arthrobacter crystallopoietes]|uniref:DUF4194 domain-containing protein n=1 Tax=Crystallibacter crystallopoietes TaxID=37928 RepID=A0A1H1AZG3_9MICC|nr:DUF4194 domain-containing protein [Arthrobacter crystallopoietes]AUI51347.1 hypothetical protein AC20117_11550 [Arthrobacter crystallopoietes]SDQ44911.1 protein of unknown function [Arthrobacter crystallopoietes]